MAQKKHKKRRHNNRGGNAVAQASNEQAEERAALSEADEKKAAKAKSKEAKAEAKAKEKEVIAKANKKAAMKKTGGKPTRWMKIKEWFKGVRSEMQRVVWPTRKELFNASAIVVGALVFFGVFIAIVDNIIVIPLDLIASIGS